jgi:stage V sporulation protein B
MGQLIIDTGLLTLARFSGRAIGFVYRLYLSQNLGPEGMGIYQQALAFYGTLVTITTAGIPFAVSRLIAECNQNKKEEQILKTTILLTIFFSMVGSIFVLLLWFVSGQRTILFILPAAVLVGFSSIFKGYYLGKKNPTPVWSSIIAECVTRFLLGIALLQNPVFAHLEGPTRGTITALGLGEAVSLGVVLLFFKKTRMRIRPAGGNIAQAVNILSISIPVSLSQLVNSSSGLLEAILVPKSLMVSGLTASDAIALYGKTAGMVMPLLGFPALLTISLSSNIIPRIAESLAAKDTSRTLNLTEQTISITFLFSFGVSAFFLVLSEPISEMLFYGFDLKDIIRGFAAGIPLFYAKNVLMSLLRGCGNNIIPLIISVLGLLISNTIIYITTTKPFFGIYGYSIALITASAFSVAMGVYYLEKRLGKKFNTYNILFKPIVCSCFFAYILNYCYKSLNTLSSNNFIHVIVCSIIGATGFLFIAKILKALPFNHGISR